LKDDSLMKQAMSQQLQVSIPFWFEKKILGYDPIWTDQ
jgi:hypothetical protein